jgi:hypothetical protein
MELFIPGLFVFFVAIAISFAIVPRFTPLLAAILSIVFLVLGVRQHYLMFASEYRLSTWQDSFKIYAPAIMIGAMILFIIYTILALFTTGSVPVPSLPEVTAPAPNTLTDNVMGSLNTVAKSLSTANENLVEKVNNKLGSLASLVSNNGSKNKSANNLSRSFLETL